MTDSADGMIVRRRVRRDGGGLDVAQEASLLSMLAQVLPLPVPRVIEVVTFTQTMVMQRLPGVSLLMSIDDLTTPVARGVGHQLGSLVAALHEVPPETVRSLVPTEPSPLEAYHQEAVRSFDSLGPSLPSTVRHPLAGFLAAPLPTPMARRRLCHNDLGAEHVLVGPSSRVVTGIIDWSDASLSDPSLDLGLIWRDLGDAGFSAALRHIHDADRDFVSRARFYARVRALEDFGFGLTCDQPVYRRNAVVALHRLFHVSPDTEG